MALYVPNYLNSLTQMASHSWYNRGFSFQSGTNCGRVKFPTINLRYTGTPSFHSFSAFLFFIFGNLQRGTLFRQLFFRTKSFSLVCYARNNSSLGNMRLAAGIYRVLHFVLFTTNCTSIREVSVIKMGMKRNEENVHEFPPNISVFQIIYRALILITFQTFMKSIVNFLKTMSKITVPRYPNFATF